MQVPDEIHPDLGGAAPPARLRSGELLERAWDAYRAGPAFKGDFEYAQKALRTGEMARLAEHYRDRRRSRAKAKVAKAARLP